jgi:photosystem II stability/assembly factor-like uncharacterized protein
MSIFNRKQIVFGLVLLAQNLLFGCSAESAKPMTGASMISSEAMQNRQTGDSQTWFQKESAVVHMVSQHAEPPGNYAVGTYVDDSHAWMRGSSELLRTSDGGRTWMSLKPAAADERLLGRLSQMSPGQLRFLNSTKGFFSSDKGIWKTTDGGNTWQLISPGAFSDLHFFNEKQGWMYLMIDRGSRSYAQAHRTSDGGETWSPCGPIMERDITDITAASENFDYWPHKAYFLNRDIGWAITTKAVKRNKTDGLLYTRDGGCNWELLWENENGPIDPDESFSDLQFIDQEHGWLAGGYYGGLYGTSDGGRTWKTLARANVPPIESIHFKNLTDGWLVSTANQEAPIMHTTNGGSRWTLVYLKDIASSDLPMDWKDGRFLQLLWKSKLLAVR